MDYLLQNIFYKQIKLGANVGDIPRGVNRPEVNPPGLGGLFEVPLALGDIHLVTRPNLAIYQQPARTL